MVNESYYHNQGITGKNVVVAIIDSGINDMTNVIDSNCFTSGTDIADNYGHGSKVAAAIRDVAPDAKLLILKVYNKSSDVSPINVMDALEYAIDWRGDHGERVNIINMSLSTTVDFNRMRRLISQAVSQDILCVCAAGNEGDSNADTDEIRYPAAYHDAVSVGFYRDGYRVPAQSSNVEKDLIAYGQWSSYATPVVSGATAILHQAWIWRYGRPPSEPELYAELMRHVTKNNLPTIDKRMIGNGRLFLLSEIVKKCNPERIDIETAIRGLASSGVIDSPDYWMGIMDYVDGLTPDHQEYYRFKYVQLMVKKFYHHIM